MILKTVVCFTTSYFTRAVCRSPSCRKWRESHRLELLLLGCRQTVLHRLLQLVLTLLRPPLRDVTVDDEASCHPIGWTHCHWTNRHTNTRYTHVTTVCVCVCRRKFNILSLPGQNVTSPNSLYLTPPLGVPVFFVSPSLHPGIPDLRLFLVRYLNTDLF